MKTLEAEWHSKCLTRALGVKHCLEGPSRSLGAEWCLRLLARTLGVESCWGDLLILGAGSELRVLPLMLGVEYTLGVAQKVPGVRQNLGVSLRTLVVENSFGVFPRIQDAPWSQECVGTLAGYDPLIPTVASMVRCL